MNQVHSRLADVLDATADEMRARLQKLRAGQQHRGLRGGSAEEIVRDMLGDHLPKSLGVTIGEVVDSLGNISGQSDVIIYDSLRTPLLFASVQDSSHTVPIEGVLGVIEVKTRLQKKDLPQLIEHARKLASLQRRAHFSGAFTPTYSFYGRTVTSFPAIYSVFAFESDSMYAEEINVAQEGIPLNERVANILCLDRGLLLNIRPPDIAGDPDYKWISATPLPDSRMAFTKQQDALVPWFAMNSALYVQAKIPPIDIGQYLGDRLSIKAQISRSDSRAMLEQTQRRLAEHIGISTELASKLGTPAMTNLNPKETLELIEAYGRGADISPGDNVVKHSWDLVLRLPSELRLPVVEATLRKRAADPEVES